MTLDDLKNAHPFNCKCQVCKNWWKLCGPEEDGTYGPFTESEILAD